jgi:arsenate reductase
MTFNVLILGTHNAARSILAEGTLNHLASVQQRDVMAYSAGSKPKGEIDPLAFHALEDAGVEPSAYHSKGWDKFTHPDSPEMRVVITIGTGSGKEPAVPHLPGSPVRTHWNLPDPAHASGDDKQRRAAYEESRQAIDARMQKLLALPLESMDRGSLQEALNGIAHG